MYILFFGLEKALTSLTIWLSSGLYWVAAQAFEIFMILANGELIDSSTYELLLTNFYVILGIVMLFIISFSLLKSMVNPDDEKTGASAIKKIIINLITSVIMIILLPTIFSFAFDVQQSVLVDYNVIGKFFGYGSLQETGTSTDPKAQVSQGANEIVNGVWTAFFNINQAEVQKDGSKYSASCAVLNNLEGLRNCQLAIKGDEKNLYEVINDVTKTGSFSSYGQFAKQVSDDVISYNFLLSLIGGLLLIYVAVSFCFDMGVRLVKLVFYQIIAPIPILFRIIPEGKLSGMFKQWAKITVTCYFEVYVRIIVLYFCVYLCNAMLNSPLLKFDGWEYGWWTYLFTKAFIIMGIVMFMKQAPKLISDVTGIDSGNMKLGIKDKLAEGGAFAAGAVIGGGVSALARNTTSAIGNIKNSFKPDENGKRHVGKVAGSVVRGLGSITAGTVSAAARSGKAGLSAKSSSDMKNAARKGAQDSIDARVKRSNYKAAHSKGDNYFKDLGRVALGHAKDFGTGVAGFVGLKNIEQMKRENYAIDAVNSAKDTFEADVDSLISAEIAKGKTDIVGIDIMEVAATKRNLDNKRANGTATKADEEAYNDALRAARYQLQNYAAVDEKTWNSYGASERAKLSKVRTDAVRYKGAIRNNSSLDALQEVGISGANYADNQSVLIGTTKVVNRFALNEEQDAVYSNGQHKFEIVTYNGEKYQLEKYESGKSKYVIKNNMAYQIDENGNDVLDPSTGQPITFSLTKTIWDDTAELDAMSKAMKRQKGANSVEIAKQEQQKYEEKK